MHCFGNHVYELDRGSPSLAWPDPTQGLANQD